MFRAPFHRQILPWLYVAVFLALAPLLIFYTSGYRWNPKKGQLERNGTLIVDAIPRGAEVWIDRATTGETSPVTLQSIAPGWHTIRIVAPGYHPWEKTLEIRAEQVTFANNVWLWKEGAPAFIATGTFMGAWGSPLRDRIALFASGAGSAAITWWPRVSPAETRIPGFATGTAGTDVLLRWNRDGDRVLVNGRTAEEDGWWAAPGMAAAERVPRASYRWDGADLHGLSNGNLIRVRTDSKIMARESLASGVADQEGSLLLRQSTSTRTLILEDRSLLRRLYALPPGAWRFEESKGGYTLLRDGSRWLAVHLGFGEPKAGTASGDEPRWFNGREASSGLLIDDNELWAWPLGESARLLWRQSEPIVQALWHRSGTTVFLATRARVLAFGMDERSGRQAVTLAEFETINGLAVLDRDLIISGTRDGRTGLWRLDVE